MPNIAILASGSGSNAQRIAEYFKDSDIKIKIILTNNKNAFVIERAKNLGIPSRIFTREEFAKSDVIVNELKAFKGKKSFYHLFPYQERDHIVVTFLAVLELMKENEIVVEQQHNLDELYVSYRERNEEE